MTKKSVKSERAELKRRPNVFDKMFGTPELAERMRKLEAGESTDLKELIVGNTYPVVGVGHVRMSNGEVRWAVVDYKGNCWIVPLIEDMKVMDEFMTKLGDNIDVLNEEGMPIPVGVTTSVNADGYLSMHLSLPDILSFDKGHLTIYRGSE